MFNIVTAAAATLGLATLLVAPAAVIAGDKKSKATRQAANTSDVPTGVST